MFLATEIEKINWNDIVNALINWCKTTGVKIIFGLLILFILFKITNVFSNRVKKRLIKKNADKTVAYVVNQILRKGLKVLWVLLFLGYIGIDTASVGTVIASLGVCIGLAVQGSLANLAGGIVIFIMRPFRIGDFIQAQDQSGTVESIKVFYTHIVTTDNKVVMIPNGTLANDVIVNVSMKDTRRVDLKFGIAYEADYKRAKQAIESIIASYTEILPDKDVFCKMSAHLDSAVEITVKVWVKSGDYWNIYYRLIEDVKYKFDELGIEIPYNKLDVNIKNQN